METNCKRGTRYYLTCCSIEKEKSGKEQGSYYLKLTNEIRCRFRWYFIYDFKANLIEFRYSHLMKWILPVVYLGDGCVIFLS